MLMLVGKGVSPGLAKGNAFVYRDILQFSAELYQIDGAQVHEEQARIEKAIDDVQQSLTIDAKQIEGKLGKESADIFRAQEAMLCSSAVVHELKKTLEEKRINAEMVVKEVFSLLARRFTDMSDEVLRERGDDIEDLSRRLLRSLAGIHAHSLENLPANTVLVARRLLPSDTVFLSCSSTVAVLAEFAGPAAHAALLAREIGIPCVGGIPKLLETVRAGDMVLVNGTEGTAVINPDSRSLQKYEDSLDETRKCKEMRVQESCNKRTKTLDGIEVLVMANVRSREDVDQRWNVALMGLGYFEQNLSFCQPSIYLQIRNSRSFSLTAFTWREENISTFVSSILAPTRIRFTSICHWNTIPSWEAGCASVARIS